MPGWLQSVDGTFHCATCRAPLALNPFGQPVACGACAGKPGLGDRVADALAAVGITKARVQSVASKVGIKDCGCAKRQAALNRAGEKLGLPPGRTS